MSGRLHKVSSSIKKIFLSKEIRSLFLFLTLILIITMDAALILPNQVLIAADLGIYFDTIGLMIGLYIIVTGISVIFFGYLTDTIERKKLLLFAGALWAFSAILHLFVVTFSQLLVVRLIAAVATGVTTPVAFSYLSDIVSSDSRAKAFALWGLIGTIGALIAGIIALAFNQIPYDKIDVESGSLRENLNYITKHYPSLLGTWRYPFLILGIIAIIFTLLNLFLTTEPKRAAKEKILEDVLSADDLQYSYKIKVADLKYVFTRKTNFFLIMNFFDVIMSGLLLAFIFPLITIEMGISINSPSGILYAVVLLLFALIVGVLIGQFVLAHWADKKVQAGEFSGRIKVATICTIINTPFLLFAFIMSPNVRTQTFFNLGLFGPISLDYVEFWVLWFTFSALLGIGLAFTMGIGPNWYAALMDVNLPEHRGTMIAVASFIDTIGRAIGAIIGGIIITVYDSIYEAIFWLSLWAGLISLCFWIPLFFTADKDLAEINSIMTERAKKLEENKIEKEEENSN